MVLLLSPPIFIVFYVALSTNRREVAQAGSRQKDSKRCGCRKWGRGWEKRDILNSKVHRGKHFDSVSKRLDQIRTIYEEKAQRAEREVHRHTSFDCTLQILYLLQIKDWWNPVSSKSVGAIFPTALYFGFIF